MSSYVARKKTAELPRLPLKGSLDLTYRCNNDCRHCWLRQAPDAPAAGRELSFDDIRRIFDEARAEGCRRWTISGGEPLIRPDFPEIFEYIADRSALFTLITNGTLITPAIARLLKRPGAKLVSLYGADAAVHDHITRTPGSFSALEQGVAYLREAGTSFTVQVVPLKDNFRQFDAMIRLAGSWSPSWRLGASWLYLSASRDRHKNDEIRAQRLSARDVISLDPAFALGGYDLDEPEGGPCGVTGRVGIYADCFARRRDFHVDPYGGMSFCCYIKDPRLRCDLRQMSFLEAWQDYLPALAGRVLADESYWRDCGSCDLRPDCRWCASYGYLEHGRHSAKVEYLCDVAREARVFREDWNRTHRRYYVIGGLTIRVDSDLPFDDDTFHPRFERFRADGPGDDMITVHHHFSLPDFAQEDLGAEVYRKVPWAVFRKGGSWIYLGIYPDAADARVHRVIVFNDEHTRAHIYNPTTDLFRSGGLDSLLLLPSDQILLARVLPAFGGVFVHAAGLVLGGRGVLFAGPSEAGKSTITTMLRDRAEILCDDRMIIRKTDDGFRIFGTWSHGEVPDVSPDSAPFNALFFLHQAPDNRVERITDVSLAVNSLLPRLVRPLLTADWWQRVMSLAEDIARSVPCYDLYFDKSGRIADVLEELVR